MNVLLLSLGEGLGEGLIKSQPLIIDTARDEFASEFISRKNLGEGVNR
jgi:hypothetical protein